MQKRILILTINLKVTIKRGDYGRTPLIQHQKSLEILIISAIFKKGLLLHCSQFRYLNQLLSLTKTKMNSIFCRFFLALPIRSWSCDALLIETLREMPSSTLQLVKEPKAYQHINQVSISIEIVCPKAWIVSNIADKTNRYYCCPICPSLKWFTEATAKSITRANQLGLSRM